MKKWPSAHDRGQVKMILGSIGSKSLGRIKSRPWDGYKVGESLKDYWKGIATTQTTTNINKPSRQIVEHYFCRNNIIYDIFLQPPMKLDHVGEAFI